MYRFSPPSVLGVHFCPPPPQTWISPKNLDFWVKYFQPQFFTQSRFFRGLRVDLGATHDEDHEYPISFVRTASYHVFSAIRRACRKCKFRVSAFPPVMLIQGFNPACVTYVMYAYHIHCIYITLKHGTQSTNSGSPRSSPPHPFCEKSWCGIHPYRGTYPAGRVYWTGPEATFPLFHGHLPKSRYIMLVTVKVTLQDYSKQSCLPYNIITSYNIG